MTYITELERSIKGIRKRTRAGALPLEQRAIEILAAVDQYALAHADANAVKRAEAVANNRDFPFNPTDSALLTRLADLILHEDLTDSTAWKSRQSEYPFLSEFQLARRRDGVHQRKNEGGTGEATMGFAEEYIASDGRNYSVPARRQRSIKEGIIVDENAKIRNKERRKRYEDFTKVQPVITYTFEELARM